jgi:hypothetical protein
MELKAAICKAFCEGVEVSTFGGGLAISTPYRNRMGDKIGVYALGPEGGRYRLVDNALTIPNLIAEGVSFESESRLVALSALLDQYGANYNEEFGEIAIDSVAENELPKAILAFSALLLRIEDLLLTSVERVESTFKEDVKSALRNLLAKKVTITEDEPVDAKLPEITPDMTFFQKGRMPVALFLVTSEPRLWQAIHLHMIAMHERHIGLAVVAMLQAETVVGQKLRAEADNRLDASPRYTANPHEAVNRVVREVLGHGQTLH